MTDPHFRRSARSAVDLKVSFRLDERDAELQKAGRVSDLGMGGVFVSCASAPPVGAAIRIYFALPTAWDPVDLPAEVRAGRFRTDLFYRIQGITLRVPALRERRDVQPVAGRGRFEREVGQLNFDDFVATSSVASTASASTARSWRHGFRRGRRCPGAHRSRTVVTLTRTRVPRFGTRLGLQRRWLRKPRSISGVSTISPQLSNEAKAALARAREANLSYGVQLLKSPKGAIFAVVGYIFYKLSCEPAPLLLGFILGPMMEENLRRALLLSRGDWSTFLTRPLSAGLLVAAALMIVVVMLPSIKSKREEAFQEE